MPTTILETQHFLATFSKYVTTKQIKVSQANDEITITPVKSVKSFEKLYGMFESDIDMADEVVKERMRERTACH
ncbi:MAG: hypothetical protein FWG12_01980 [Holophagaceae bacterium]|nr:hypothetical protein [Holophagaceae bacterium]